MLLNEAWWDKVCGCLWQNTGSFFIPILEGAGFWPLRYKKLLIFLFLLGLIQPLAFGQIEFTYDAKDKRNPFIPLVTPEGRLLKLDKQQDTTQQGLAIEGIIYDELGRSFAIVNANVVGIGDMVGDFQVLKILKHKVIFIRNGEPVEIDFIRGDIE